MYYKSPRSLFQKKDKNASKKSSDTSVQTRGGSDSDDEFEILWSSDLGPFDPDLIPPPREDDLQCSMISTVSVFESAVFEDDDLLGDFVYVSPKKSESEKEESEKENE